MFETINEMVSIQKKVMKINCNVVVDAWLLQIVVTGCEVGIFFLFTQTMLAIELYHV